jgi:hypothetical protein
VEGIRGREVKERRRWESEEEVGVGSDVWEVLGRQWYIIVILDYIHWTDIETNCWRLSVCIYCYEIKIDWERTWIVRK